MSSLNSWISDIESAATTGAGIYAQVTGKSTQTTATSSQASGTSSAPQATSIASQIPSVLTSPITEYVVIGIGVLAALIAVYLIARD